MPASITATPTTGTAANTVVRFDVADLTLNDIDNYDDELHPSSPELRYYVTYEVGGDEFGRSYVFAPSPEGDHQLNSFIFPSAGTWTVAVRKTSDDSSVATTTVVVA